MTRKKFNNLLSSLGVLITALIILLIVMLITLLLLGKDPARAGQMFLSGALGSDKSRADVAMAAVPLLLAASGLLLTFTAGLWNIGIEGQIVMGAVFSTAIARLVTPETSPWLALPLELGMAMLGGALWAGIVGLLKIFGNVNEIFGGVALNFIAQNVLLFLLTGDWKAGTYPQTAPFADPALLPRVAPDVRLSPLAILIAILAYLLVFVVLRGTRFGLQLRAMGKSEKSAFLLGVRTKRNMLLAIMWCGALAGLAGAVQALFTYGQLTTGISSGIGFLGVLVVLLTNVQPLFVPLVAIFFAIVPVGNLRLASAINDQIKLETSLGNAFMSALVLLVLLFNGVKARWSARRKASS